MSLREKSGRPPKPIDWIIVDQFLMAGCTGTEIAANFHIYPDTLYRRVQDEFGITFTDYAAQYDEKGKSLLRVKQFEKALEKDNSMLIWLGKQRLGQKDKTEVTGDSSNPIGFLLTTVDGSTKDLMDKNDAQPTDNSSSKESV